MKTLLLAVATLVGATTVATATPTNLVTNAALEGANHYFFSRSIDVTDEVNGWTVGGYGFLSYPGRATNSGQNGSDQRLAGGPTDAFCNPGSCANGFVDDPSGLNFIVLDGEKTYQATILQTINGLTAGKTYKLSFDWAAAQPHDETVATTDQLTVSLGSSSAQTAVVSVPLRGFHLWQRESFNLIADGTSDTLSFTSGGTPDGFTPLALLSGGISLTPVATPEPGALALFGLGGMALGMMRRRK